MIPGNIFGTYAPEADTRKRVYVAYGLATAYPFPATLDITRMDGSVFTFEPSQWDVVRHSESEAENNLISVIFDTCSITMRGRHLDCLHDMLTRYVLSFAERFNPAWHSLPPSHVPLIETMWLLPALSADGERVYSQHEQHIAMMTVR